MVKTLNGAWNSNRYLSDANRCSYNKRVTPNVYTRHFSVFKQHLAQEPTEQGKGQAHLTIIPTDNYGSKFGRSSSLDYGPAMPRRSAETRERSHPNVTGPRNLEVFNASYCSDSDNSSMAFNSRSVTMSVVISVEIMKKYYCLVRV